MVSISETMMRFGFQQTQSIHGEPLTITSGVSAGQTFIGVLLAQQDVKFDGEVVQDNREKVTVHFADNSFPNVSPEDTFKDSAGQVWRFGKRVNNPRDSSVDFEAVKVIAGIDN